MFVIADWRSPGGTAGGDARDRVSGLLTVAADTSSGPEGHGTAGDHIRTVANPNDYACVLLLMVPFMLWLALSAKAMVYG